MSATAPIGVLKELVNLIEHRLGALLSLPSDARQAVKAVTEKAQEIATTFGFEVGETSTTPLPKITLSEEARSNEDQNLDNRETDMERDAEHLGVNQETDANPETRRKHVKRRKRRVDKKISKRQGNEEPPLDLPDFEGNRDLKYLVAELARRENEEERVQVLSKYLGCCKFNTVFQPESIITFSDEEGRRLGLWTAQLSEGHDVRETPQIIKKLECAMEQKFQLTAQQAKEIGKLLLRADAVFKENVATTRDPLVQSRGRPTSTSLYEVLSKGDLLNASKASLQETTHVAMTMLNFPLLSYVNEPISHLADATVRSMAHVLTDTFQETCSVPENIATAYNEFSPYVTNTSVIIPQSLYEPILLERLVPNDGDGLVQLLVPPQQPDALEDATYHRLHGVDAPELFVTHFIKEGTKVLKRHNGHLSHLAVHFYIRSFGNPLGTGLICREKPRRGETPTDHYQRPISSFWFLWTQPPNVAELSMLDEMSASLEGQENCVRARVMSLTNPRVASMENPFLLSLNALLVLSGFCHVYTRYSPDINLLKLQKVAKDNNFGCIWSGGKKNFVLGAKQKDYSGSDQGITAIKGFNLEEAKRAGFPLKFMKPDYAQAIRFQPWYERKSKKELENATRSQFRDHQSRPTRLPYGFVVDMQADISLQCSYKTVPTGEAFLQVRPSLVVGIGGAYTGRGVFTLKQIPEGTWITSYAPTAPVRLGRNHESSDFILKTVRDGSEVEIDGALCPLGLGCIIQDGSFPFSLASEKFASLVKARINCEWANREGEIWFKSTRVILAGEELLTRYSHNNSYWSAQFSTQQLQTLRHALLASPDGSQSEAERIVRNFHLRT